jgi:4-hydroxybenzoate polyprenyltransferase
MKKLFYLLLFIVTFKNITSFTISKELHYHNSSIRKNTFFKMNIHSEKITTINKFESYNKLLRTNNVFPTFLLNILGGWLTIPSYKLFLNKNFWIFSLITQLTMMNSMVINDLFDLKIDLINNNNRPLVNKKISIKEAQCLYITLNTVIVFLSIVNFYKNNFYIYICGINIILFLYTPFLKKMMLVKNITCASVVSSTVVSTYKSISNKQIFINNNMDLIQATSVFLFLSSFYIELLLDIKDIHGDKENNIVTIPNYFGAKKTFQFLTVIFITNLFYYSNYLYNNNKYILLFGFITSNINFIKNLIYLQLRSHSHEKILQAVKDTTTSLIIFIIALLVSV